MKPLLWLLVCALGLNFSNAQEILLEGQVYDRDTEQPIPYVNISLFKTLKGTSTDENGHFYLELPEVYKSKQVHVSALGYGDTITTVDALFRHKKIGLRETSFELDEVVISEELGNMQILNPLSSSQVSSGFSSSSTPWIIAVYFPNTDRGFKLLDKITIYLQRHSGRKESSSKCRLRIFNTDGQTGLPGDDLLRESLIINAPSDAEYIVTDLKKYRLQLPDDGVYIGLEWLFIPYNWYKESAIDPISRNTVVEDRFSPTFAGVYNEDPDLKAVVYGSGQWRDFRVMSRDKSSILIPAISVKVIKE